MMITNVNTQMRWGWSFNTTWRVWGIGLELDFVDGQEICLTIGPWVVYVGRRLVTEITKEDKAARTEEG